MVKNVIMLFFTRKMFSRTVLSFWVQILLRLLPWTLF